jgi:hypothetical protein
MTSLLIQTRLKCTTVTDMDHIADLLYMSKKVTEIFKLLVM